MKNNSKLAVSALAAILAATSVVACAPQMKFSPGYLPQGSKPGSESSGDKKAPAPSVGELAGFYVSHETVIQVQDDGAIQMIYSSDRDQVTGLKMVAVVREKSGNEMRSFLLTDADCKLASVCNKISGAEAMKLKNRLDTDEWNNLSVIDTQVDSIRNLSVVISKLVRISEAEVRKEVERVKTAEAARDRIHTRDEIE